MTNKLKIANCRGSKPVIREIRKCRTKLQNLLIEINECSGKKKIEIVIDLLLEILEENK
jgi:hypothetical protein